MKIILIVSILLSTLYSYQLENKLKVLIIGKVAKYISWPDTKENQEEFVITILKNSDGTIFDKIYHNKKIKHKPVTLKYIDSIDELEETDILFISSANNKNLPQILKTIETKEIFTVSDIRGFAEKGGMMQIYFASQRVKLKINLDVTQKINFKIKSSLLRIADVLRGTSTNE